LRIVRGVVALSVFAFSAPSARGEEARDRLAANDPAVVYQAAVDAVATKDVTLAAPLLEAALRASHGHVAIACGDALAALGDAAASDPAVVKLVQKAAKGKEPRALQNLARVLGAWGHPTVDEPLAFLAQGRRAAEVQAEALHMLGWLKPGPTAPFDRCLSAVRDALESAHPDVQSAACSAAGRLADRASAVRLETIARTSTQRFVGLHAVAALVRLGHDPDLGGFLNVVGSAAKKETVAAALRAVTDLCGPEDLDALFTLTRSSKKDHRDAACIALSRVAARIVRDAATPAAAGAAGQPARPTAPASTGAAKEKADPIPRIAERMVQMVETDTEWEVRWSARGVLIRLGDAARPFVAARMPKWLDDPDRDLALTAMELCGEHRVETALRELTKIAIHEKDPAKRMFAARAAGSIDPRLAVEAFTVAPRNDKKGKDITLSSVRALGYVRDEASYRALLEIALSSADAEPVRAEAERALERLTGRRFGRTAAVWDAWYQKTKAKGPFSFHVPRHDRSRRRAEAVDKRMFGVTEGTERAVEAGLRWLELQQKPTGEWDGNEKGFNGFVSCEPAYTGLCVLAFLGAGYGPEHGKFRECIRRATEYLVATQLFDGSLSFGGAGDQTAFFAYVIGMGVWALNEVNAAATEPHVRPYAERGLDYLVGVQTPGAGWRYGPRYLQSDTSATSWVLMGLKAGLAAGLHVPQRALDGVDLWLEGAQTDMTGEVERPEDLATDYDKEVGARRAFRAVTGYLPIRDEQQQTYHQESMTPVGMVCRFFLGWRRSHPFLIGSANYTASNPPQWMKGTGISEYYYYWYYGTLAMHQMGGRFWRAWNGKISTMLPEKQRYSPTELAGSWDPDTSRGGGGRLFSTPVAILTLETYYRFSPMLDTFEGDAELRTAREKAADDAAMADPVPSEPVEPAMGR
jgi:hypothetical protein